MARLTFHGAAGTVTGSCYLLEHNGIRLLIDCGLFQGSKTLKQLNYEPFPFNAAQIDAVLLTHAHIDHSGLLPKLSLAGFGGPIYAIKASIALLGCMLPDAGHIQETEVEMLNRRRGRRGWNAVEPIYTVEDAKRTLNQLEAVRYDVWIDVADGIKARWWNAGHLLGSASIEVAIEDRDEKPLRLLFSGDIGPDCKLLEDGPRGPAGLDFVICESTYGDRERIDATDGARRKALAVEVGIAQKKGGALVIPSFAVERTQELIVDLSQLMEIGQIADSPIFVDSPLASKATEVFKNFAFQLRNGKELVAALGSGRVHITESVEESKALARFHGFHVIIAASGMCEAGRIRHHLMNWLPRPKGTVLIVGFQARGTLGRILLDGDKRVRIMGETIVVQARVASIDSYSGHADRTELITWVKDRQPIGRAIFLTHGEDQAINGLREALANETGMPPEQIIAPALDQSFLLTAAGTMVADDSHLPRLEPAAASRMDWHNDLSKLLLDIDAAIDAAADEKARQVILRRLRRALENGDERR
ncbi:MAG: MBL fold metallo-hydrolase RNA specificity domain-containing protein [Beijerinckiaceae bacterium]